MKKNKKRIFTKQAQREALDKSVNGALGGLRSRVTQCKQSKEEAEILITLLDDWKYTTVTIGKYRQLSTSLRKRVKVAIEEELETALEKIDALVKS